MIPLVGVPKSIAEYLEKYRELFKRQKGFETVSRCLDEVVHGGNPQDHTSSLHHGINT